MPKVSIIIPIYNAEKYLRQCLDSCINQTLKEIEIICVNDGSSDDCTNIINEYAQNDKRIKLINQSNQGLSIARNNGLAIASGEYILFLDSDDWLDLSACEITYNQAKKYDNDFLLFNYYHYFENKNKCIESNLNINKLAWNKDIDLKEIDDVNYLQAAYVWNKIYKRQWLIDNEIKFIKMEWEDLPFTVTTIIHSKSMSVVERPLYFYRLGEPSLTLQVSPEGAVNSKDLSLSYILEAKNNKNMLKVYLNYYFKAILYWYTNLKMNKYEKLQYKKLMLKSFKRIENTDYRAKLYKIMLHTKTFVIYSAIQKIIKIQKWLYNKALFRERKKIL